MGGLPTKGPVASFLQFPTKISPTIGGYNLGDPLNLTGYKKEEAIAGPTALPPPPDEVEPMMRELSRSVTEKELRRGSGRQAAMSFRQPYGAAGTKRTTGV